MRKKIALIVITLLLTIFTTNSFAVQGEEMTLTNNTTNLVTEGEEIVENEEKEYEIIEDDFYWISEENYTMDKLVDGNAYLIVDGNITFSGSVKGAVYILANGTVEFTQEAYIADAVYIVARNVKVNAGEIYDIYSASDNLELMKDAYIARDLKAIASNMKLTGMIYRHAYLSAENIEIKDETSELFVGGNFNYSSSKEIEGIQDIVKYGDVNFTMQEDETEESVVETTSDKISDYVKGALTSVVYVLVIYGILKLTVPKFIEKAGTDMKEKSIVAFSVGLLSWVILVLAIVVSIIVVFMPFGLPVAIIAWIVMLVVIYASSAVFSIAVLGVVKEKVEKIRENIWLEIIVLAGIAILVWLLQKLPYIGDLASFVIVTTGVGLIIRNSIAKRETKKEEVETTVVEETNTPEQ